VVLVLVLVVPSTFVVVLVVAVVSVLVVLVPGHAEQSQLLPTEVVLVVVVPTVVISVLVVVGVVLLVVVTVLAGGLQANNIAPEAITAKILFIKIIVNSLYKKNEASVNPGLPAVEDYYPISSLKA